MKKDNTYLVWFLMKNEKFDELVELFARLPGVGKKSAQKYAYFVALGDPFLGRALAASIEDAIRFLRHCERCGAISEHELCDICSDSARDKKLLCVVESAKDIITIESSHSYEGLYFVLSSTNDISKLKNAVAQNGTKELIFALTPGLNSDAIMLYVENELGEFNLNFTKIAQGIPTGVSLENVDTLSLSKALKDRNSV